MAIYNSADYAKAREVNLVDYLQYNGYELRREGNNYAVITYDATGEHDSLKVSLDGKKWNWFSRSQGGESTIQLVSLLDEIEKPYAIKKLADYAKGYSSEAIQREKPKNEFYEKAELKPFELPEKWGDNKRAFAYLTKNRELDDEVVNHCIDKGLIYESKKFHNVVFVGQKNEDGEVQHASLRGTYSNAEKPFKGDVTGSNKDYSFALEGNGNWVYVYESAIDALSHATMEKKEGKDWRQAHRVTLGGMSDRPLELYLQKHKEIKGITFCLDNDLDGKDEKENPRNHGQIRADNLIKKYYENGFEVDKIIPQNKDMNEDLKKRNSIAESPIKEVAAQKESLEKSTIEIQDSKIMDQLTKGVEAVFTSSGYLDYLKVMAKFHSYSVNNCLLIALQNPKATRVAGYNAWMKLFGRQVKKGENGIQILAPAEYKKLETVDEIDPSTGAIVPKTVEHVKKYFKPVKVFDVEQTDGKELPELASELEFNVENVRSFLEAIKKIAESSNISFSVENIQGGAKGYFSSMKNKIAVKESMSDAQTIKTAIHELAHSRLHIPSAAGENTSRNTKEVEAESVAFVVANHFGIDTSNYSFPYIASWSSGKETKELKASLDIIRKESTDIIKKIEKEMELDKSMEVSKNQPDMKDNPKSQKKKSKQELSTPASKKADSESMIPVKNYENSLTILAQKIPLFLKEAEGFKLIKSENEIISTTELTYLKTKDLEKNKSLIPKIYNSYLVKLFNDAFQKNPMEAMKIFEIDSIASDGLAKAFICNDVIISRQLEKAQSINDCIDTIGKRIDVIKKIDSNALVHIKSSESPKIKPGEVFSFKAANKAFQLLEKEASEERQKTGRTSDNFKYTKTEFALYVKNNNKWLMGQLRYDIGDSYAKDLTEFLSKQVGGRVAEICIQELEQRQEKTERENLKTIKREEKTK